ncbi:hypothetical protein MTO96_000917 [Rhipicephalus appendiculatus]
MCGPRRSSPLGVQRLLVSALLALSLAPRSVVRCLQLTDELQRFVTTLERYARTRNDIVFVLDESGSIGEDNFPAEMEFTQLTARLLTVSPDFSRIAVVTYGSDNKLHFDHISGGGSSMCGFLSEIEKIGYRGGGTKTREALEYADRLLQNGRYEANRIIVLISDGQANDGSKPQGIARALRGKGVIIFAVGVAGINRAELEEKGYEGAGTNGTCRRCKRGEYKKEIGSENCKVCPDHSTTSDEGANSLDQCLCIPGYEGNPGSNVPCRPIKCAKLSDPPGGSTLPHPCGNTFGNECDFKCNEGYCPYSCNMTQVLAGKLPWNSKSGVPRVCQANKQWSGGQFICDKVRCPALNAPSNGNMELLERHVRVWHNVRSRLLGGSQSGRQPPALPARPTAHGSASCQGVRSAKTRRCRTVRYARIHVQKAGDLLTQEEKIAVDGTRKCLENGKWQGADEKITCQDVEPPVIKNCPEDIEVNNAPHSQFSAPVKWDEPSAEDNSKRASAKLISPNYVTALPWEFSIGEHLIQYVARDDAGQESKPCSFKLTVRDVEPPTLTSCPEDIILFSAAQKVNVTWKEPTFTDNGGDVTVTLDRPPGRFTWGPPSVVNYTLRDASGNTACCTFKVIVKPYKCPYLRAPRNGYVTCDADEQHSSTRSPRVNITVGATYKTNSCQMSEERMKALKARFLEVFMKKMGHILCKRNHTCSVENVSLRCESTNSSRSATATYGQRVKRWLTKRQAEDGGEEGDFNLSFSFDLPLDTDFNATELIDSCEDCKNSSLVPPSAVEETAFTRAVEQALREASNETVAQTFPDATLVGTTHAIKATCGRGQVPNGLLCVNCPIGTYYYNSSCVSCPIGTYSDREASETCDRCPGNKTTLDGRAGSVSECLDLCAPGTWSTTGKEPCTACDPRSYQDEVGQLSCKACPPRLVDGLLGCRIILRMPRCV